MPYILIAIFSYWFSCLSGVPGYVSGVLFNFGIKRKSAGAVVPVRLLPFSCEKCLAFWMAFIYSWINWESHDLILRGESDVLLQISYVKWFDPLMIVYAGCTSFGAIVIGIIINKIR